MTKPGPSPLIRPYEAGYKCPVCGFKTAVKDSRAREDGTVRRRRYCPECQHRFTTLELLDLPTDIEDSVHMNRLVVILQEAHNIIEELHLIEHAIPADEYGKDPTP